MSIGNFALMLLLARLLPLAEFGVFALLFGLMLFLNKIHESLVLYPLTLRGARAPEELRPQATAGLSMTLLLVPAACLVVGGAMLYVDRPTVILPGVLALLMWQLQETSRRVFFIQHAHGRALAGDALAHLGKCALVVSVGATARLGVSEALLAMALASFAGFVLQLVQLRLPGGGSFAAPNLSGVWRDGRWVLLANVLSVLTIQAFPWVLAVTDGVEAAGILQALANLLAISHPLMTAIVNVLLPAAVASHARNGTAQVWRFARRYGMQGALVALPVFTLVFAFPREALGIVYGAGSPYPEYALEMRLFVLGYVLIFAGHLAVALLQGYDRARDAFRAQLASGAVALLVGIPAAALWGLLGAMIGILLTNLVRVYVAGWALVKLAPVRSSERSQEVPA